MSMVRDGSLSERVARLAELCLQPQSARAGSQALIEATSDVRVLLAAVRSASTPGARKLLFVRVRAMLKEMDYRVRQMVWQDMMSAFQVALDAGDLHESLVSLVVGMLTSLECHKTSAPSPLPLAYVLYRAARHAPVGSDDLEVCRQPVYQRPMLAGVAYVLAQDLSFMNWDAVEFADESRAVSALAQSCMYSYAFHATPALQRFLETNVDAIPTRAARRAFIERYAPQMSEHMLFLEPEEEDMLQEIISSGGGASEFDACDMQTTASRLRELQTSLMSLPRMRAPGNPLGAMTDAEFLNALRAEVDGPARADVLLLLIVRMRGSGFEVSGQSLEDLEDIFVQLVARNNYAPCVRLAVAMFGFCDMEALLLARQTPLDEVAVEYFSHRLPRAVAPLTTETLLGGAPWVASSSFLDALLANFAQQAVAGGELDVAFELAACGLERALPPIDALSLLCCIAPAALQQNPTRVQEILQLALAHVADETEDALSAARRFALICHVAANEAPLAVLQESAILATNEEFAFIYAQILVGLLRRARNDLEPSRERTDASEARVQEELESVRSSVLDAVAGGSCADWTALLVALHDPARVTSPLGVLLSPSFDFVAELPPVVRKRVVDGALNALINHRALQMLDDREAAVALLAKLFHVLGSVSSIDLADDAAVAPTLPFDRANGIDIDLFPNCDLKLNYAALDSATPALFDNDWPNSQLTVLRCAVAHDDELGAVVREALHACESYTFPALRSP